MNISKISRSLVVAIFVVLIAFIGYQDINLVINNHSSNTTVNIFKIIYVITTILLVVLYVYIKDKLYRKKVKRNVSLVYRYIYIVFIVVAMSIISIYPKIYLINNFNLFLYVFFKIIIAIVFKKIIFNVSKSDILSVLGMFIFAMLPCAYSNNQNLYINLINTLSILATLLVLQRLIDELKQKGIKTKKYLILSIILGFLIALCIFEGINPIIWIVVAVLSLFLTYNLDKTHISFPRNFIANVNSKTKDTLYKIERVNINKIVVSILISIFTALILTIIFKAVSSIFVINNDIINIFKQNQVNIFDISINDFVNTITGNTNIVLSFSKTYYLVILVYIVFIEILAVILHRRYDTKSTVMKLIFILLYISISIFKLDIIYYQTLLTVLLILISIVNTSNIYLNREERIKMLVA